MKNKTIIEIFGAVGLIAMFIINWKYSIALFAYMIFLKEKIENKW